MENISLVEADLNAADFISNINTNSVEEWNQKKICLHDLDNFFEFAGDDPKNERIDKEEFLESVKVCRWYGPYKSTLAEQYFFYSVNKNGDNRYFVEFLISLDSYNWLNLRRWKGAKIIARDISVY